MFLKRTATPRQLVFNKPLRLFQRLKGKRSRWERRRSRESQPDGLGFKAGGCIDPPVDSRPNPLGNRARGKAQLDMTINIEFALVVGLFVIGAIVLALDDVLDASYRWIVGKFRPHPPEPKRPPRPRMRNLHDL